MDTLYTFWDNITHYKTKSVHFWGLMNSATKIRVVRTYTCKIRGPSKYGYKYPNWGYK